MILKVSKEFGMAALFWACVIFIFTSQTAEISSGVSGGFVRLIINSFDLNFLTDGGLEILHTVIRKFAHFTEFFILGALAAAALHESALKPRIYTAAIFCAVIASTDEALQLFVPGREGKITDVLLDCTGAVFGIAAACLMIEYSIRRKERCK